MRIVVLAPVHVYDDVRVFRKESVTLAEAGNDVTLFARTPDGQPLTDSGVRVRPVRYRSRSGRFAMLPRLARAAFKERADVYHVHNPDTLPIGFALRLAGRRVIYDTHEDFRTEILLRRWLPALMRRPAAFGVAAAERLAGRWLDAVIVTQRQLRHRIPEAVVIGNPPVFDEAAARAALVERRRALTAGADDRPEPLVLAYIGGISADRGLFRMMRLVAAMNEVRPARLLLIGYPVNDDALRDARELPEWELVDYLGQLPQDESFAAIARARAGLILFEPVASHATVDPNKIYEYLTLGVPFIATDFEDWRNRLGGADAGIFIDPDAADAAGRVLDLVADTGALLAAGEHGVAFVAAHYSWQRNGAPELLAVYDRVMAAR